jgi:sugar diacid utilization regulator
VRHVEQLLLTAIAEGHTEAVLGPDDLLVVLLPLGHPRVDGALRRRFVALLQRRDPSGAVMGTLRAYLATGSDPETARQELVHANTVSYRLGRVREITGLDPRVPRDAALLVLGLGLPEENP